MPIGKRITMEGYQEERNIDRNENNIERGKWGGKFILCILRHGVMVLLTVKESLGIFFWDGMNTC
jgi:hypothetical protein